MEHDVMGYKDRYKIWRGFVYIIEFDGRIPKWARASLLQYEYIIGPYLVTVMIRLFNASSSFVLIFQRRRKYGSYKLPQESKDVEMPCMAGFGNA